MNELLLELFSEEIPARMQVKAAESLLETLLKELQKLRIEYSNAQYFVTPRRITLYVNNIPSQLPEQIIEKKGPKVDAKHEAIEGFLRSVGLKKEELSIIDGCFYANKLEAAKQTSSILQNIIEQALVSFTWPKSMRLSGESRSRWVRPLRNILCLFDNKILPVSFASLQANNYSFGHRFMAPEKLEINSFIDYKNKMEKAFVLLSDKEREKIIISRAQELAKEKGLNVILETNLLNEVVGLIEYPNILLGTIEPQFMELPKEVLVSAMKNHQRYFYLEDNNGNIAPYFIFVSNIKLQNDSSIIAGNEKVLKARFSDAKFFWEQDLKIPYSQNLAKLAKMTFHSKLGNMFDKTNRIIALAEFIADKIQFTNKILVKKAALLAKTDLVSEMVGEFPELQGTIGKYYAQQAGEEKEVALAIEEHYRPIDNEDTGNISLLGTIIAISDKLDSIIGLWIAGEKPTSSKDPFALRRAALGIIKLIKYHQLDLSLKSLLETAISNYNLEVSDSINNEITIFFNDRLKYYLKAEGFRHDLIMASLATNSDNIYNSIEKLIQLQEFMKTKDSGKMLFSIKRVLNILDNSKPNLEVKLELLQPVEQALYNKFLISKPTLEGILELSDTINKFFDDVLVNDSNLELKQNRLNLLYNVAYLSKKIADFNLIEEI